MLNLWFKVVCSCYASVAMHSNIIGELQNTFNFDVLRVLLKTKVRSKALACCVVSLIYKEINSSESIYCLVFSVNLFVFCFLCRH